MSHSGNVGAKESSMMAYWLSRKGEPVEAYDCCASFLAMSAKLNVR